MVEQPTRRMRPLAPTAIRQSEVHRASSSAPHPGRSACIAHRRQQVASSVVATGDIRSRLGAARARLRSRSGLRWVVRARLDLKDRLTRAGDPLMPPRRWGLPSQLPSVGARLLNQALIDAGGLQPNEHVLDIGCGAGRVAAQLTRYLDPASGSYEGLRRHAEGHRLVHNVRSRPVVRTSASSSPRCATTRSNRAKATLERASTFQLPYADGESTHPSRYRSIPTCFRSSSPTATHVFVPGCCAVATFFLLNPEVEELIAEGVTRARAPSSS